MSLNYHTGTAHMVTDALSRLSIGILSSVDEGMRDLVKDIHCFANLRVHLLDSEDGGVFIQKVAQSSLSAEIKEKQMLDPILLRIKGDIGGKR